MTREEAIAILQDEAYFLYEDDVPYNRQAFEMAIKALSQEPCDDAISRILTKMWNCRGKHTTSIDKVRMEQIIRDELPSVTQKSGKWVEIDDEPHEVWECDHCGFVIDGSGCIEPYEYRDTYKFCPNCGAKMVEPQESEDKE